MTKLGNVLCTPVEVCNMTRRMLRAWPPLIPEPSMRVLAALGVLPLSRAVQLYPTRPDAQTSPPQRSGRPSAVGLERRLAWHGVQEVDWRMHHSSRSATSVSSAKCWGPSYAAGWSGKRARSPAPSRSTRPPGRRFPSAGQPALGQRRFGRHQQGHAQSVLLCVSPLILAGSRWLLCCGRVRSCSWRDHW